MNVAAIPAPIPAGQVRRTLWRNLLVTLAVNTLATIFIRLLSDATPLWRLMVTIHAIGLSVFVALTITFAFIKPSPRREPWYFLGATMVGAVFGLTINLLLRYRYAELVDIVQRYPSYLLLTLLLMALAASVTSTILWGREKAGRLETAYHEEQAKRLSQEKLLMEAQLRMLQAQIEPHFLFNTLANVQSLVDASPDMAKHMLALFNDYLRASLDRTRTTQGTVRLEFELLTAYLGILQIRMGERLRFSLDCPEALLGMPLPPMLLQPLVENAVRHGLESKVEGGTVNVTVVGIDGELRIEVRDDGLGLPNRVSGRGVGLSNVRARLAALYGGRATLELSAPRDGGTLVRLMLPEQADTTNQRESP